jgi:ParB family chromosome partitioning protein
VGTGTYETWPVEKPIVKENVRKQFSDESLRRHADSLKRDGQLRPLLVLRDGTLVAGERTLRAAKLAGLTHVDVKVLEGEVSRREVKKLQLIENLMREGLKDAELYLACTELTALNPEWLKKDLAAELHCDPSMVTRIFSVDELIPEAKEAFLAGAFGFSKAYAIAKGSKQDQIHKLTEILAGTSRDEVERQGRKSRNGGTPGVKVSRIKCPLPSGVTVQVSGSGISLDLMVEAMQALLKKAKKSSEQGWDIKTFERACRDEAKLG